MSDLVQRRREVVGQMAELAGRFREYRPLLGCYVWKSWDAVVKHNQLTELLATIDRHLAVAA